MISHPNFQLLRDWLQKLPTYVGTEPIASDSALIDSGILDSISVLELVSFIEETFSVELPLEEFMPANFHTPATVLAMIDRIRTLAMQSGAAKVST